MFERATKPNFYPPQIIGQSVARWGEWISIPEQKDAGILRARLHFSKPLMGKLKKLLYKEEEFFIEYFLGNGEARKHRMVLDNAVSGIWISPYVENVIQTEKIGVEKIKFSHSPNDFIDPELKLDWEYIRPKEDWYKDFRPQVLVSSWVLTRWGKASAAPTTTQATTQ